MCLQLQIIDHDMINFCRDAVKYGKCVVIGLQSTGEARTLDQLEKDDGELNDFVSTAKYELVLSWSSSMLLFGLM